MSRVPYGRAEISAARARLSLGGVFLAWCPECDRHYSSIYKFCPEHGTPLVESTQEYVDPLIGMTLDDRYTIDALLGEGAMGRVYKARQLKVGREVAVKVLNAVASRDSDLVARFEAEARIISRLRHPNTLKLFDFGRTSDGQLFIVVELLQGVSLEDELKKAPIEPLRAVRILNQVFDALSEAHEFGIIHRDLKPANIMLEHMGGKELVKVVDFGIAKVMSNSNHTATGRVVGSPAYMSPEQVKGSTLTSSSDLYSMGIVGFEMLTGRIPFSGSTSQSVMLMHLNEGVPLIAQTGTGEPILHELRYFIGQLMCKAAEERPANAAEASKMAAAIEHILLREGVNTGRVALLASMPPKPTDPEFDSGPVNEAIRASQASYSGEVSEEDIAASQRTLIVASVDQYMETDGQWASLQAQDTPAQASDLSLEDTVIAFDEPLHTDDAIPEHPGGQRQWDPAEQSQDLSALGLADHASGVADPERTSSQFAASIEDDAERLGTPKGDSQLDEFSSFDQFEYQPQGVLRPRNLAIGAAVCIVLGIALFSVLSGSNDNSVPIHLAQPVHKKEAKTVQPPPALPSKVTQTPQPDEAQPEIKPTTVPAKHPASVDTKVEPTVIRKSEDQAKPAVTGGSKRPKVRRKPVQRKAKKRPKKRPSKKNILPLSSTHSPKLRPKRTRSRIQKASEATPKSSKPLANSLSSSSAAAEEAVDAAGKKKKRKRKKRKKRKKKNLDFDPF